LYEDLVIHLLPIEEGVFLPRDFDKCSYFNTRFVRYISDARDLIDDFTIPIDENKAHHIVMSSSFIY